MHFLMDITDDASSMDDESQDWLKRITRGGLTDVTETFHEIDGLLKGI